MYDGVIMHYLYGSGFPKTGRGSDEREIKLRGKKYTLVIVERQTLYSKLYSMTISFSLGIEIDVDRVNEYEPLTKFTVILASRLYI